MIVKKIVKSILPVLIVSSMGQVYAADRPNILLIMADDLGYSDLQPFGGEIKTPNLNKLAQDSMILKNFYSGPTCSVTRSMLLTGNDNHQAGVGTMVDFVQPEHKKNSLGYKGVLNNRVMTIAEILKDNGYFTVMSGKWHLGGGEDNTPTARGFEKSFSKLLEGGSHFGETAALTPGQVIKPIFYEDTTPVKLPDNFYSSDYFADKLIDYLKQNDVKKRPFFGYLAFTAPHFPLQAHQKDVNKYQNYYKDGYEKIRQARYERMVKLGLIDKGTKINNPIDGLMPKWEDLNETQKKEQIRVMQVYAGMIDNLDQNVGKVLDYLKSIGELDNTLILFTSDNGAEGVVPESFGVSKFPNGIKDWIDKNYDNSLGNLGLKGSYAMLGPQWAQVSSTPMPYFKGVLSQGGIRVPTLVRYPKLIKQRYIKDDVVHVMDFVPTVLDILSLQRPTERKGESLVPLEGQSFLPVLNNKNMKERSIGWEFNNNKALIKGDWLILNQSYPYGNSNWQLFNLKKDPTTMDDVASKNPDVLKGLITKWNDYAQRVGVVEAPVRYKYGKVICLYNQCTDQKKVN